ncbi:hypothetical protein EIN_375810 [Entamoeba invadens IP1]|uniref:Uncharacterized protein n=1 Tax=Entamoeba invadens IP1 TaxID=370355 RepID=A0A0A1TY73_ENTIV|nr:hypothetical protein EIN_375810 [Entamoeba invadens IP1]ELP83456.1 hypothetical protein EIN_375810 [Entamoeba invadens IP1]|eukprot:XP_004182802.1 hypothetical protein EIN_375810 [Entamoeba invadens IP1]
MSIKITNIRFPSSTSKAPVPPTLSNNPTPKFTCTQPVVTQPINTSNVYTPSQHPIATPSTYSSNVYTPGQHTTLTQPINSSNVFTPGNLSTQPTYCVQPTPPTQPNVYPSTTLPYSVAQPTQQPSVTTQRYSQQNINSYTSSTPQFRQSLTASAPQNPFIQENYVATSSPIMNLQDLMKSVGMDAIPPSTPTPLPDTITNEKLLELVKQALPSLLEDKKRLFSMLVVRYEALLKNQKTTQVTATLTPQGVKGIQPGVTITPKKMEIKLDPKEQNQTSASVQNPIIKASISKDNVKTPNAQQNVQQKVIQKAPQKSETPPEATPKVYTYSEVEEKMTLLAQMVLDKRVEFISKKRKAEVLFDSKEKSLTRPLFCSAIKGKKSVVLLMRMTNKNCYVVHFGNIPSEYANDWVEMDNFCIFKLFAKGKNCWNMWKQNPSDKKAIDFTDPSQVYNSDEVFNAYISFVVHKNRKVEWDEDFSTAFRPEILNGFVKGDMPSGEEKLEQIVAVSFT